MIGARSTIRLWRPLAAIVALATAVLAATAVADSASVIRTGTVSISGTVTISSAVTASDTISASAELATFDSASTDSQSVLTNSVTVTRSGSTATISGSVPYSFIFNSSRVASGKITTTVTLYVNNTQAYASSNPITVPASGTTTPVTFRFAL